MSDEMIEEVSGVIELTKTEVDQLNFRESLIQKKAQEIQVLNIEIELLKREGELFLHQLVQKRGAEGVWRREGNNLVPDQKSTPTELRVAR